jgi:hypothetical protein
LCQQKMMTRASRSALFFLSRTTFKLLGQF